MTTVSYDPYAALGVRPIINARGHQTVLGGSTPSPRVRQAMQAVERYYAEMPELLARSGEIISGLLECEAAYVTSGAFAALVLGTAACITGNDVDKMGQVPQPTGRKNKVLLQVGHHYHYERAPTIVGASLVEVGADQLTTSAQLEEALGADVAAVLFPAHLDGAPGTLSLSRVIEIAHRHGVPVLVDAAGRVYPLELMKSYTRQGADLVAFGAKYVGGPNSSGILCGRRELVEAAVPQGFAGYESIAYGKSFGRGFKIDRQEVVAVVVALQEWFEMDHEARLARLEQRLQPIASAIADAPGVSTRVLEGGPPAPRLLEVKLSPGEARHDVDSLVRELHDGEPGIVVMTEGSAILVNPVTVLEGDEELIARRLAQLLR